MKPVIVVGTALAELLTGYTLGGLHIALVFAACETLGVACVLFPETLGQELGRACYTGVQCFTLPPEFTKA